MSMVSGQVTVTSAATPIVAGRSRTQLSLVHHGGADVFIGGSDVTTSTGALLTGTKGTPFASAGNDAVYGITASGSAVVGFVENY